MTAQELFLEQYGFVAMVSKGMVYAGLSEAQLRRHPLERQSSLAWLQWHATRWEDAVVNSWIAGQPPVLDRSDWLTRLGAPERHCGTAATFAEAASLSERLDL
jgi:hypothetical protein